MGNRKLAIGAALLCCIGSSVRADSVSSYFGGLRYDFSFTCLDLGKAPLWLERDAAPPLAPRNALSIARRQLDGLVPNSDGWRLNEVSLRPGCSQDKWYYVVGFSPPPPRPDGGITTVFRLVVLMNGQTMEPAISAWPAP